MAFPNARLPTGADTSASWQPCGDRQMRYIQARELDRVKRLLDEILANHIG